MKLNGLFSIRRWLVSLASLGMVAMILAKLVLPAYAAAGDLDTTFGIVSSGINVTDILAAQNIDAIYALALQTDDAIVAAGQSNNHFALARYDPNGSLDTAGFNAPNGSVMTVIDVSSRANSVAIQGDGKIVVAGESNDGLRNYFTVARYNSNGTLDTTGFNAPNGYITSTLSLTNDVATGVVMQSDDKIVVGGYADLRFAVARYNTDGTLDTTGFNAPLGYLLLPAIGSISLAQAIGLQSDGKIILGGHADMGASDDFVVARVTTSGALDLTFNGNTGYRNLDFPTNRNDLAQALAIQADDKIVLGGESNTGGNKDFALARINANGTVDNTFGTSGRVITSINPTEQAFAVGIQPNGRIVLAGTTINAVTTEDFAVARYTSAGVLDITFGGGAGYVTTNIGDSLDSGAITADLLDAALIQADGKIVVGGHTDRPLGPGDDNFAVARYLSPNTAPTVVDFARSGTEDIIVPFPQTDFTANFADADGDSLVKVMFTTLPSHGTLKILGVAVTLNQEVSAQALGNLTYFPDLNYNGSDAFTWAGSDGLAYSAVDATATINLSAVNDAPINSVPAAFNVNEDGAQANMLFSISDVDAGSASTFQFTLSASNGILTLASTTGLTLITGSNASSLMTYQGTLADINAAIGDLSYGPDADYNGGDIITLLAKDNGNSGSGGALQDTDQVAVTVDPVNDAPSFTKGPDVTVEQNAAPYSAAWATNLSAGPADESSQALSFLVTGNTNPALFNVAPAIAPDGTLTFSLALNAYGAATITLKIQDDGGIANGGVDTSVEQTFVITATPAYQLYLPMVK